ncbi:sensor histidine kinase [Sphingobacterium paludis]|uniref:histidine kinase n=1 Tax=Sphingobacterium paludis TaxID=1476465 RepID=A0A4R7CU70_9SPHI|nr:HAMP domain-containing sensor histidine kinase [Sphingobacterium paludis]TDS11660.1 signal transduction histidine kinase [Sphingobacterium paludis]
MVCCLLSSGQQTGWDKLNSELAKLSDDSLKVMAHYKVSTELYKSAPQEAKEIAEKGYQLAVANKMEEIQLSFLNVIGVIESKLYNFDESINTHFKVLRAREKKGDRKGAMLSLLNIGNVFNVSRDAKQALVYYEQAMVIAREIGDVRNEANIAINMGNIRAQGALKGFNKSDVVNAITYLLKTIDFAKRKAPEVDLYNCYILLGYLYLKNEDVLKSEYYTDLAINIAEAGNFTYGICYSRINRANIFVRRGQFDLAQKEVEIIRRNIQKSGLHDLFDEFSSDFQKIAKAVKENDKHVVLTDVDSATVADSEEMEMLRLKVREELREKYETEKKELENKNLQLENVAIEGETLLFKLLLGGALAVLLTFVLMLILLQRKNVQLRNEKRNVEQARDEIKEQAERIHEQHKELFQADRFRSRIFSVVSHDLRAPIANFQVLLSVSKLIDLPADDVKRTLIAIGHEVETASKMLDELLVWSSQQMGNESLEMQSLAVFDLVEVCKSLFSDRLDLKELHLKNLVDPTVVIQGDLKRFEFILRNIISNAIKFSYLGKSITVRHEDLDKEVVIGIADEGAGMDKEKLSKLQKRDVQESYLGTLQEKGAGIGLMLCHEFANRMGWYIRMESTIGLGSTFYICIPKNTKLKETHDHYSEVD